MAGPAKDLYRRAPLGLYEKDVELFYAVEVYLGEEVLRVWSGLGDISLPVDSTGDKYFNAANVDNSATDNPVEIDDTQTIWFRYTGTKTVSTDDSYATWVGNGMIGIYFGIVPFSGNYPDWTNEITDGVTKTQDGLYFDVEQAGTLPTNFMFAGDASSTSSDSEIPMTITTTVTKQTFVGAGSLMSISQIEDSTELKYPSLSVGLSGLPADTLSNEIYGAAFDNQYQGEAVNIYIGAVDKFGKASVMPLYQGMIDVINIDNTGDSLACTLTVQNKLNTLMRPRGIRYTEQRQLEDFAGDTSLRHVTDLQDISIEWG